MVPIVVTDADAADRRKEKKHIRKEARLSIAHVPGDTTLKFGVEFQENVDEAGKVLFDCACRAGGKTVRSTGALSCRFLSSLRIPGKLRTGMFREK